MTARIRTRFAPSPTGFIHLGNIRSALYPWAFARSQGGDFILRIEDTDEERSSQAAVDVILEAMEWLGLTPDEGPFYQMQRMDRYRAVVAQMKAMPTDDDAYGPGTVRQDGMAMFPSYLFQVKAPSESKYPWDYFKQVVATPADKAWKPLADGGCTLVKA